MLVAVHSFFPLMVARIAQGHAAVQLVEVPFVSGHASAPLALSKEGIVAQGLNQFIIMYHCFVVVSTWKNGASVNNPAGGCAVNINDDCWVPFLAFVLPVRGERSKLPCTMHAVHTGDEAWQTELSKNCF
jgi:hypothetical protein